MPIDYHEEDCLVQLGAKELARRFMINERVRKHWRILAIGAAIGRVNLDALKMVCFREIIGIVPEDAELDPLLAELVDLLEDREALEEKYGNLRAIDLRDGP